MNILIQILNTANIVHMNARNAATQPLPIYLPVLYSNRMWDEMVEKVRVWIAHRELLELVIQPSTPYKNTTKLKKFLSWTLKFSIFM